MNFKEWSEEIKNSLTIDQVYDFLNALDGSPKKQNEFAKYFNYRDQNIDSPITKKMISNLVGVDRHLIGKWDDSMVKNKLLLNIFYFNSHLFFNLHRFIIIFANFSNF